METMIRQYTDALSFRRAAALVSVMLLALPPADGSANEVLYVTDRLTTDLLAAPDSRAASTGTVAAGTRLEVLSRTGGMTRVRTETGNEGWLPQQLLTDTAPAPSRIAELERRNRELEVRIAALGGPASPGTSDPAASGNSGQPLWLWLVGLVIVTAGTIAGFRVGAAWSRRRINKRLGGFDI